MGDVYFVIPTKVTAFDGATVKFTTTVKGGEPKELAAKWNDPAEVLQSHSDPKPPVAGEHCELPLHKAYCATNKIPTEGKPKVPDLGAATAFACLVVQAKRLTLRAILADGKEVDLQLLDGDVARDKQALVINQSGTLSVCLTKAGVAKVKQKFKSTGNCCDVPQAAKRKKAPAKTKKKAAKKKSPASKRATSRGRASSRRGRGSAA